MEKPWTIGFSRQGEMDYPIQYEIVYAESPDRAMFKWIKDNPKDIWRSYSNCPSTELDIEKYGNMFKIDSVIDHELRDKIKSIVGSDIRCYSGTPIFRLLSERIALAKMIDSVSLNDSAIENNLTILGYYDINIKNLLNL